MPIAKKKARKSPPKAKSKAKATKPKAKPKTKHKSQDWAKGSNIPMSWKHLAIAIQHVPRVYLWGPPGVGKSHLAQEIARQNSNKEPFQVTLNEDMVAQELLGHYVPEGDKFVWHDGPIASAIRHGEPLVINEIARASGAVQDLLLGVLDDPSVANIALPNKERLRPAPGFRVYATANTPPDELDEALRDRFDVVIEVNEPNPDLIKHLNTEMANLGDFIRDSYKDVQRAISPRKAFAFLRLFKGTGDAEMSATIVFRKLGKDFLAAARARQIKV